MNILANRRRYKMPMVVEEQGRLISIAALRYRSLRYQERISGMAEENIPTSDLEKARGLVNQVIERRKRGIDIAQTRAQMAIKIVLDQGGSEDDAILAARKALKVS